MLTLRPDQAAILNAAGPSCCVEGCNKNIRETHGSSGMCGKHAQRVRRYGDPHYVTSSEVFKEKLHRLRFSQFPAKPTTYRKYKKRHHHRVVAEQILGRPLAKGEIVHHKDGNKHNNSPDNLEVMTQSQHMKEHWPALMAGRKRAHGY